MIAKRLRRALWQWKRDHWQLCATTDGSPGDEWQPISWPSIGKLMGGVPERRVGVWLAMSDEKLHARQTQAFARRVFG